MVATANRDCQLVLPLNIPLYIPLLDRMSLVVRFLSLRKGDLAFGKALLIKVKAIWHDGIALFFRAAFELAEL